MSYLLELFRQGKLKPPAEKVSGEFIYHSPCHMLALGEAKASIELLRELCGIDTADIKGGCCGLAGTFGMQKKNRELSSKIAARLKEKLKSIETENILTECSACGMQIEHISNKSVIHPIKIIARSYLKTPK